MSKYDVVVIGSGLGGLECAAMLSKEGMSVCVVEKNHVFGGCLQSFRRAGHLLDTGIHYIGSSAPGQIMDQYFRYLGLRDRIKLKRLDDDAFDVIHYPDREYNYAMGYENFAETLADYFPAERANILAYTEKIKDICGLIGVERLRNGIINGDGMAHLSESASAMIDGAVRDPRLASVLAGTVTLYGGRRDYSTLYHHAMITGSNIEGAYRIVDGSQSVADGLIDIIRANGGTAMGDSAVTRIVVEGDRAVAVEINGVERIEANHFISNLHPALTFELADRTGVVKKAYLSRINSLPNTYGLFSVYLIMKRGTVRYVNRNHYLHAGEDAWYAASNPQDNAIKFALVVMQANSADEEHANVVNILCPMHFGEVEQWSDTRVGGRGKDYEQFKARKAEQVLAFTEQFLPEIRKNVEKIVITTPLTYRDYTGTVEGSAYGIMKGYRNPLVSLIPTQTKIKNLYLTGQNLNVHGMVGVTLTSTLTCAELLGAQYLARKIGDA